MERKIKREEGILENFLEEKTYELKSEDRGGSITERKKG